VKLLLADQRVTLLSSSSFVSLKSPFTTLPQLLLRRSFRLDLTETTQESFCLFDYLSVIGDIEKIESQRKALNIARCSSFV
jgi:hypothetical protein